MRGARPWVVTAALAAIATPAWAGGPDLDDDGAAARIVRGWRRQGAAAIPAMGRAVCDDGPARFQASALLVDLGEPAVGPLFELLVQRSRECLRSPLATLGEVIHNVEGRRFERERPRPSPATRSLLRALGSADGRRVAVVLDVIEEVAQPGDWESDREDRDSMPPDREAVRPFLRAAVAPMVKRLERGRGAERNRVLAVLEAIGEDAAAAAPAVLELLADGDAAYAAAGAATALGPPGVAAVPALRRLLAAPARPDQHAAVVQALRRLGPAARAALPELSAHLGAVTRRACDPRERGLGRAVAAVLAVDPAGRYGFAAHITSALDRLRRCAGDAQEGELFRALHSAPPALRAALLLPVVRDEGRSPGRRIEAADALAGDGPGARSPPLPEADRRLIARLRVWKERPAEPAGQVSSSGPPRPDRAITDVLARCREQAEGRSTVIVRTETPPGHSPDEDEDFIRCLRERLCGPTERDYRRVVGICCRYAHSATMPSWCRP